jgi:hypothetical protein
MDHVAQAYLEIRSRFSLDERFGNRFGHVDREEPLEVVRMAFIITGAYIAALFSLGVFFIRREKKERRDKEEHCAAQAHPWQGPERRTGQDRRHDIAAMGR